MERSFVIRSLWCWIKIVSYSARAKIILIVTPPKQKCALWNQSFFFVNDHGLYEIPKSIKTMVSVE